MNDDLNARLRAWEAPPVPERTARRIASLLDDRTLPGPVADTGRGAPILPLAYAAIVALLVVTIVAPERQGLPTLLHYEVAVARPPVQTPGVAASAQATATAISAIELDGFEVIAAPRIRVNRRTP